MSVRKREETIVIERWLSRAKNQESLNDAVLASLQKAFRHYRCNVYLLNSMALRIQHWFFVRRHKHTSL